MAPVVLNLARYFVPPAQARQSAPRRVLARGFFAGRLVGCDSAPGYFSEGAPAAPRAFPSHPANAFVAELRRVESRLTARKVDDDFCRPFPIGDGPQIKLGNDRVESLNENRYGFRIEVFPFQYALDWHAQASQRGAVAASHLYHRARSRAMLFRPSARPLEWRGNGRFRSRPNGVNAGDLFSFDRVGEPASPDAEHVVTIIDKAAGVFYGRLGARKHHKTIHPAPPILDVPFHR